MKKPIHNIITLVLCCYAQISYAQLTGIKTIGGASPDYATLALAITDLNTLGVGAGGVTFNLVAGHTETASNLTVTATGTATAPIVFQKSGVGSNPLITATAGTSTTADGVIKIVGSDYITFDGIDLKDPTTNTNTTTRIEWGYAILKGSATDGCDHITIKNCTITLQRAHNLTKAIYIANHTSSSTSALTITALSGIHSSIDIFSNYLTDCYSGVYILGATNSIYYDDTIKINQNKVINFGGTTTAAYGIYLQNFRNAEVREDSIYNGLALGSTGYLIYGVYTGNASDANVSIVNNSISFPLTSSNSTRTMTHIYCSNGSAANTIIIDSNRISNGSYRSTSGNSYVIYASSTASTYIRYNKISNCTRTGSSGDSYIIYTAGNSQVRQIGFNTITGYVSDIDAFGISINAGKGDIFNNSISSSTISGPLFMIYTTGEGNIYENSISGTSCNFSSDDVSYIYANLTSGNLNIYKNLIFSNTSAGGISDAWFMYVKTGATNQVNIYENVISGNSHTGSISDCFALFITGCSANVYKNQIHTLSTDADLLVGIELASSNVTYNVSRNIIYGFSSTDNGTVVSGIRQSAGNTATIDNNVIGLLKSGNSSTTTNGINGINITSGTVTNLYHNTVYLNATSSGGSNCIYLNSGSNAKVINNLLVNLSANGSNLNRSAVALKRSSTSYTTYDQESDNNFFYVGTTAANRYLYTDGSNSHQTIASYKTYAGNKDQNSLSADINFASIMGAATNFLQPADTTVTESAGKIIAGIVGDYLADSSRKSYPLVGQLKGGGGAPDIGAHELDLTFIDNVPPSIVFTPITKALVSTTKQLEVSITDASGVNTTFGTGPRLYFKKSTDANALASSNSSLVDGWKYVETYNISDPFSFTIDYSLLYQSASVSAGDVIQYFIVAADNFSTPNLGVAGATLASPTTSTALTASQFPVTGVNSYTIQAGAIPPVVTVGNSGATYTSLTMAGGLFEAINNGIIGNDVSVQVTSDLNETGAVALNKFTEDGFGAGTYRITIQPSSTIMYNITGSNTNGGIIRMVDAHRVTIDGSYFGGGRYFNIVNNAVSGTNAVIHLAGSGINGGCNNIMVKNCNIWTDTAYSTITQGVFVGGTTVGTGSGTQQGYNNRNITISNNTISKVYNGVLINGIAANRADSIYIINNEIGSDSAGKYIGANGVFLKGVIRGIVKGNSIYNVISPYNSTVTAINCDQDITNTEISANRIYEIKNTANASVSVYGIYSRTATNTNILIKNNTIGSILGQGASTDITSGPVGIYLNNGSNYDILNNSISLNGNRLDNAVGNAYTACVYVRSGVTGVNLSNNVLKNVMTSSNILGPGSNFALVTDNNNLNAFTRLNNNLYYANSTTPGMQNAIALTGGNVRASLSAWRSFANIDMNSLWGEPGYISDAIVAPDLTNVNIWNLNGRGYPMQDVSTDIVNTTRSLTLTTGSSDIGAFEVTPAIAPPNAVASASPAAGTTTYYTVAQDTIAAIDWAVASNVPSTLTMKYYSGTTPPAANNSLYMNAYWQVDATPNTGLSYNMTLFYKPEAMYTVTESSLIMAKRDGTAFWTPFTGGTTILNQSEDKMTVNNLTSFSSFTGTDQTNPLPVKLIQFSGKWNDATPALTWSTASEQNCSAFEIERLAENGSDYEVIGRVDAKGTGNQLNAYAFNDNTLAENTAHVVYRLKIIDMNGEISYSKILILEKSKGMNNEPKLLTAYPNPFNNTLYINLPVNEITSIEIKDLTGKLVYSRILGNSGIHELNLSDLNLANGLYMLYDSYSGKNQKLIKVTE